jgi:hypothetical protein
MNDSSGQAAPLSYNNGKTAGIIHGLALVSLAATIICGFILEKYSKEYCAALGVGGTATLVYGVWSLVLAYRALKNGEKPGWPLTIFLLVLLELSLFMLSLWIFDYTRWNLNFITPARWVFDFSFGSALPIILPCLFVVSCIGWPVAAWRVRRAERQVIAAGGQPWTRSRRCKRGLVWYGIVASLLTVAVHGDSLIFRWEPMRGQANR